MRTDVGEIAGGVVGSAIARSGTTLAVDKARFSATTDVAADDNVVMRQT